MNRQPYKAEKRRKEIARQKKQEEKRLKRLEKKKGKEEGLDASGENTQSMESPETTPEGSLGDSVATDQIPADPGQEGSGGVS